MQGLPRCSVVKNLPANAKTQETWIRSLGWEDPLEEGMPPPLQYCFLEIPMDRGAWWATVHGIAESNMTESAHAHTCKMRRTRHA